MPMLKNFIGLEPWDVTDLMIFEPRAALRNVRGVVSSRTSVFVTVEGGEECLFASIPAGDFELSLADDNAFALRFVPENGGHMSVRPVSGSTVVQGSPDESWTVIEQRPAVNPQLAAVMRQLRAQQLNLAALEARASKRISDERRSALAQKEAAEKQAAEKEAADKAAAEAAAAAAAATGEA